MNGNAYDTDTFIAVEFPSSHGMPKPVPPAERRFRELLEEVLDAGYNPTSGELIKMFGWKDNVSGYASKARIEILTRRGYVLRSGRWTAP